MKKTKSQVEKNIIEKIDDYLKGSKGDKNTNVWKNHTEFVNVRMDKTNKRKLQKIADQNNIDVSMVIRGFSYLLLSEKLDEIREWLFSDTDKRKLDEILKSKRNTKNKEEI